MTNDLVKDNPDCVDLVADAMNLTESKTFSSHDFAVSPRKSLFTPALVAFSSFKGKRIQCYFPHENRWRILGKMLFHFSYKCLVSCCGKIYGIHIVSPDDDYESWLAKRLRRCRMMSYDPYSNSWMSLLYKEDRDLKQIFVGNDDELYALVCEPCAHCFLKTWKLGYSCAERKLVCFEDQHASFITKYKTKSDTWKDVSSFPGDLNLRHDLCIIAKDNFIYFIGGVEWRGHPATIKYLVDVDRYDLSKNQWDKVADIQMARSSATGAAANGKIFIAGGVNYHINHHQDHMGELQCEVFSETTNEWQFISMFGINPSLIPKVLAVDDELYVVATQTLADGRPAPVQRKVELYDPDTNRWKRKTKIPVNMSRVIECCSMRIFKGFLNNKERKEEASSSAQSVATSHHCAYKRRQKKPH